MTDKTSLAIFLATTLSLGAFLAGWAYGLDGNKQLFIFPVVLGIASFASLTWLSLNTFFGRPHS